ncbi:succinate receptor 1-like [Acanthochromis polyacanthus]|uniref:succinate receptor 1-like n=1 Tax=Acanthochromis polyacanthus TaxID=80966 RepID=UPI002234AC4E|nr:succinate receptor 1-like [Acanthochromis polyacanthus]
MKIHLSLLLNLLQPPAEVYCDLDTSKALPVVQLYVMPSFFLAVLILGLPLNLLSLWVFSHRLRRWTRSTVFLFNLTLADFSWLLALPFLIHYHLSDLCWTLGLPLCTAVRMLYHNYFYLSIFFVTCISVDRYLAIVHPLRSLVLLGRRQTYLLCAALWTSALLLSVPVATMTLIQTCPGSNRTICTLYVLLNEPWQSLPYSLSCSILGFLVPLLCICYCGLHSVRELRRLPDPHNKQLRLRRLLSAVLVLFALFYLPYHLSRNASVVVRAVYQNNPSSWGPADMLFSLEMCFCGLITCVNPLFSCFIGRQFRKEFYGTFVVMFPHCGGLQVDSVKSKRSRMTVRRRQKTSAVTPVCEPAAPRP